MNEITEKLTCNNNIITNFSETFPLEIFQIILFYQDEKDIQSTAFVSHYWKIISVQVAKEKEITILKQFAKIIEQDLKTVSKENNNVVKLLTIIEDIKNINATNLVQVKSLLPKHRFIISESLKHLDLKKLDLENHFKSEIRQKYFENVLQLAQIYKSIDLAMLIESVTDKDNKFFEICPKLVQMGDFNKAFEIIRTISAEYLKTDIMKIISEDLIKNGLIDEAIDIATSILNHKTMIFKCKSMAIKDLYIKLKRNHSFKKIFEIINAVSDELKKKQIIIAISKDLIKNGLIDNALEIAKSILNNNYKSEVIKDLCIKLVNIKDFNKALEIINTVSSEFIKKEALKAISKELIQNNLIDKAVEIATSITDNDCKTEIINDLYIKLINVRCFKKALEIRGIIS